MRPERFDEAEYAERPCRTCRGERTVYYRDSGYEPCPDCVFDDIEDDDTPEAVELPMVGEPFIVRERREEEFGAFRRALYVADSRDDDLPF